MNKRTGMLLSAFISAGVISVQAEVIARFLGTSGSEVASTTLNYDLDASGDLVTGDYVQGIDGNTISSRSAAGTFSVTMTALDNTNTIDPLNWNFGSSLGILDKNNGGIGVTSGAESGGPSQLFDNEAILLTFDLSGLTLGAGDALIFKIGMGGGNSTEALKVYQRTASGSGAVQLDINQNLYATDGTLSAAVTVEGYQSSPGIYEFVLADSVAGSRFGALSIDVLGEELAPIQHLDATVTNSVTGSPVTEWADLSGNNNHAITATGSVDYPSTSLSATGLAGVDFGSTASSLELFSAAESDSWLDQTSSNGFAVLVAFKCDEVIGDWNDLIGNNSAISSGFGMRYSSSGQIVTYLGGQVNTRSANSIQAGDSVVFAFNYDAVNGKYTFWDSNNGDSITLPVAAADFSLNTPVTLGLTTSGSRYFNGMVGEVKVFDLALTPDEFETEYTALFEKWAYVDNALNVSTIFQNNMVLQRDMDVPVWGTAGPGAAVTVKLDDVVVDTVTADAEGKWMAHIGSYPHDGGTAHTLEISAEGVDAIVLTNVVFGDVYLAAGQSNMYRTMNIVWGASDEAAGANYPLIRELTIEQDAHSLVPYENAVIKTNWRECSPSTAQGFSATAYFFAKNLYLNTGVPVGLLNASWGAHQIMHFIAPEGVAAIPELTGLRQQLLDGPEPTSAKGVYYDVYNSMIHPLVPYGIRGFVWYQCEWDTQNDYNRQMYHQKMRALMAGWREIWGLGDLPFYYVQLPTWDNSGVAGQTRESQLFALSETNAGMAVTIDIGGFPELEVRPGTTDDPLHPANKQDIGRRLALWAQRDIHGQDVVPSGPIFKEATVEGTSIRVSFDYADGLFGGTKYITNAVVVSAQPLDNFEIAGSDGVFVAADAVIDGQTVVVSSPSVSDPVDVRYCFSNWPDRYNVKLYNSASLPALPFRTDVDYGLLITSGDGDGWYDEGETVSITADAPAAGKVFDRWVGLPSGIADPTASSTTLTMPAHQTYLMAVYRDSGESTYTLTVNQGDGDGPSKADCYRAIKAEPAPPGYRFSGWTGDTQTVENISAPYTTLSTSLGNLSLSPVYELIGTLYDAWSTQWGDIGSSTNDADGDGLSNLEEYGYNGNPTNSAVLGTLPTFSLDGSGFLYVHPQRSDDDTLVYTVQTRTNLVHGSWTNAGYSIAVTNVTGNTLNLVTNDVAADEINTFIRLIIEQ